MISEFKAFTAQRAEINTLSELAGATVAIEAGFFLQRYFDRDLGFYEALSPALGGLPFGLRTMLEADLAVLKASNIQPLFVFDGLDVGKKFRPFQSSNEDMKLNEEAWDFYLKAQERGAKVEIGPEELLKKFEECSELASGCSIYQSAPANAA